MGMMMWCSLGISGASYIVLGEWIIASLLMRSDMS